MAKMICYHCNHELKMTCDHCGTANWLFVKRQITVHGIPLTFIVISIFAAGFFTGMLWS